MSAKRGRAKRSSGAPSQPPRFTEESPAYILPVDDPEVISPSEVPDIAGEEQVVLNRRGIPARARKRNRLYFDDDNDTGDLYGLKKRTHKEMANQREEKKTKSPSVKREIELDYEPSTEALDMDQLLSQGIDHEEELPPPEPTPTRKGKKEGVVKARVEAARANREKIVKDKIEQAGKHKGKKIKVSGKSRGRIPGKLKMDFTRKKKKETPTPSPEKKVKKKKQPKEKEPVVKTELDMIELDVNEVKRELFMDDLNLGMEGTSLDHVVEEVSIHTNEDWSPLGFSRGNRRSSGYSGSSPQHNAYSLPLGDIALPDLKQSIDKKTAQEISLRLRNLLKLPKAHKWVCYEWFYSNIDKVLFEGENDFQICLKESFPQFKAKKLTRVEWCKIRRMMGKPRRCSQAFFDEEREELGRRRQKIRMIQQRKITDFNYKELPDEIPLQLTIGTKVTARLRRPQDGLFTGTIDGVDTSNNTYRITFDRTGLGTHSIPDYEVLSNEAVETVSTSSFALKIPRRSFGAFGSSLKFGNSALLADDGIFGSIPKSPFPVDGMLGGFPIRLLDMIVRLSKLLKAKREKISQLKELNVEAEKLRSYGIVVNDDYRMRYAYCILDLDSMNKEMGLYLDGIQTYCLEQIAPDHGANLMIVPEHIQDQCRQEAQLIVDTYNTRNNKIVVNCKKTLSLIASLCSLLLQVKTLSSGDRNLYELKSVKDTVKEVKATLEGKNLTYFQNNIEIPMNRITAGLSVSQPSKNF